MNLNKLLAAFAEKKHYNLDGKLDVGNGSRFYASTGYNGRGDAIEVSIDKDGNINFESWAYHYNDKFEQSCDHIEEHNITEERVYELLK
jgi:hypothetical protein